MHVRNDLQQRLHLLRLLRGTLTGRSCGGVVMLKRQSRWWQIRNARRRVDAPSSMGLCPCCRGLAVLQQTCRVQIALRNHLFAIELFRCRTWPQNCGGLGSGRTSTEEASPIVHLSKTRVEEAIELVRTTFRAVAELCREWFPRPRANWSDASIGNVCQLVI